MSIKTIVAYNNNLNQYQLVALQEWSSQVTQVQNNSKVSKDLYLIEARVNANVSIQMDYLDPNKGLDLSGVPIVDENSLQKTLKSVCLTICPQITSVEVENWNEIAKNLNLPPTMLVMSGRVAHSDPHECLISCGGLCIKIQSTDSTTNAVDANLCLHQLVSIYVNLIQ